MQLFATSRNKDLSRQMRTQDDHDQNRDSACALSKFRGLIGTFSLVNDKIAESK